MYKPQFSVHSWKRKSVSFVLAIALIMSLAIVAFAASSNSVQLDGGDATWYGGITDKDVVYSKVWDHYVDQVRYTVTVWVQNDKGDKYSRTGTTYGVNEQGEVKVTCAATNDNPYVACKAGYKDFKAVDINGNDLSSTSRSAPVSYEIELWYAETVETE